MAESLIHTVPLPHLHLKEVVDQIDGYKTRTNKRTKIKKAVKHSNKDNHNFFFFMNRSFFKLLKSTGYVQTDMHNCCAKMVRVIKCLLSIFEMSIFEMSKVLKLRLEKTLMTLFQFENIY